MMSITRSNIKSTLKCMMPYGNVPARLAFTHGAQQLELMFSRYDMHKGCTATTNGQQQGQPYNFQPVAQCHSTTSMRATAGCIT